MLDSLLLLDKLPPKSLVFPGHEYAEQNLAFALFLEPENEAVLTMYATACKRRAERKPVVSFFIICVQQSTLL